MIGETPSASLRDELNAGFDAATNGTEAPTNGAPPPVEGEVAQLEGAPALEKPNLPPELPALEAPAMWKQAHRDIFGRFAGDPDRRELLAAWQEQWKETEGAWTRKNQEFAEFRRNAEPLLQTVAPFTQYWAQQGLSPAQGVTQLMSYAQALESDPRGTLQQLAQMYGVDLAEMVAEQPYVDPQVAALQQQIAQLQQANQSREQSALQAQQNRIAQEIQAFQSAVDETGSPKAPHFERVFDTMLTLAQLGKARDVQSAYDMAVRLDPALQAEITQQQAAQQAAAQAAAAKKALEASKTVQGRSTASQEPVMTMREELLQGLQAAGWN